MKPLDVEICPETIRILRELGYCVYSYAAENGEGFAFILKCKNYKLLQLGGFDSFKEAQTVGWKFAATAAAKIGDISVNRVQGRLVAKEKPGRLMRVR